MWRSDSNYLIKIFVSIWNLTLELKSFAQIIIFSFSVKIVEIDHDQL